MSTAGKRILIDTDPGIDDAMAIAMALRSPELRVVAVTTVYGNGSAAITARNARHLLQRMGAPSIPHFSGARRPLVREPLFAVETHGEEGLGYAQTPAMEAPDPPVEAPQAILSALSQEQEPLTLVALGPLTNVALALALDRERCQQGIGEIVWMGGSAGAPGNTTPVSEFNAWSDPEAVRVVMESAIPLRMVGLDATRSLLLPAALVQQYAVHPDPEVRWWAAMWRFYVEFHRRSERLEGCIMNDPLAIVLLLWPKLGRWERTYVQVDCSEGLTRGQTICDRFNMTGKAPNVQVCLSADGDQALTIALERGIGVRL